MKLGKMRNLTVACLAFVLGVLNFVSCTSVPIADAYSGKVADAETGTPLSVVAIQVVVMRVSTYDGSSQFRKYRYTTNERGEFVLPARKKVVDTVTERVEEIRYYEIITFSKDGYAKQEFRTDDDEGLFSWSHAGRTDLLVRMKKQDVKSAK